MLAHRVSATVSACALALAVPFAIQAEPPSGIRSRSDQDFSQRITPQAGSSNGTVDFASPHSTPLRTQPSQRRSPLRQAAYQEGSDAFDPNADPQNESPSGFSFESPQHEQPGHVTLSAAAFQTQAAPQSDDYLRLQDELSALRNEFGLFKDTMSKPKLPGVELHGAFQVDQGLFDQSPSNMKSVGNIQDGASFRRARLSANGSVMPNMNYFVQMDFAFFGRPTFTDLWMEVTQVPVFGNIRVGQWKQPFSLEVVSSFRYTTFAERSLLFQTFTPFRHIAIGFYDWSSDERMTWAASFYRAGQDQFGGSLSDGGGYAGVGRVTWLPMWDDEANGSRYLHLGGAYNIVSPKNHTAQFRTIPEYYVGEQAGVTPTGTSGVPIPGNFNGTPFLVDTSKLKISNYQMTGTELLLVDGPFSLQSEAMLLWADRQNGPNVFLPGFYVQAGYFLTGEHRPYNRKAGAIDRIQVLKPLGFGGDPKIPCGWGGWEVASRLSWVDLNDHDVKGGKLMDVTLGLNWFLNSYSKVQFNYIRAFLDSPTNGHNACNIYGLRAQVDF